MKVTPAVIPNMRNASQLRLHGGVGLRVPSRSSLPRMAKQDPGHHPDIPDDWRSANGDSQSGEQAATLPEVNLNAGHIIKGWLEEYDNWISRHMKWSYPDDDWILDWNAEYLREYVSDFELMSNQIAASVPDRVFGLAFRDPSEENLQLQQSSAKNVQAIASVQFQDVWRDGKNSSGRIMKVVNINYLIAAKEVRQKGAAAELLDKIVDWAKLKGHVVTATPANDRAQEYYRYLGFELVDGLHFSLRDPDHPELMVYRGAHRPKSSTQGLLFTFDLAPKLKGNGTVPDEDAEGNPLRIQVVPPTSPSPQLSLTTLSIQERVARDALRGARALSQQATSTPLKQLRPESPTLDTNYSLWGTYGFPQAKQCAGKYYYEVLLGFGTDRTGGEATDAFVTGWRPQIGWATDAFVTGPLVHFTANVFQQKGVGDDADSWAADGVRMKAWHIGEQDAKWPRKWAEGDIIGFGLDMDAGRMDFSLNGQWIPEAGMKFGRGDPTYLYPAISSRGSFAFHLGSSSWSFAPPSTDYQAWLEIADPIRRTIEYKGEAIDGHPWT